MMRISSFVTLLLILTACVGAQTTISVDPSSELHAVNPLILGNNINWPYWQPPRVQILEDNGDAVLEIRPEVIDAIAQLGLPSLRYPGGLHSNRFDWSKAVGPMADREENLGYNGSSFSSYGKTWMGPMEFMALCESLGTLPVITAAYYDGTQAEVDLAADWVEFMNAPNDGSNPRGGVDYAALRASYGHPEPYHVQYWQIGNEPWHADPCDYSDSVLEFSNAMKAVDPTIKIGIFGGSVSMPWFDDAVLANDAAIAACDFYIKHPYFGTDRYTVATHFNNMMNTLEPKIAASANPNLVINLSEHSPVLEEAPHNVDNAIAVADLIRVMLLRPNVHSAMYWTLINDYGYSSIASVNGDPTEFYYRVSAHVLRLFNHHFGTMLVQSSGVNIPDPTGDDDLTYIASKDGDGNVYLMVINKSASLDHAVTVNVSGLGSSTNAQRWHIAGQSLTDYNTTSFGLDWADKVPLEHWYLNAIDPTNLDYTFPAHSVTMLMMGPGVETGENPIVLDDHVTFYLDFNDNTGDPAVDGVPSIAAGSSSVVVHGTPLAGDASNKRGAWDTTGYHIPNSAGFEYEAVDNVNRYTATVELYTARDFNTNGLWNYVTTVTFGDNDYINLYVTPVGSPDTGQFEVRLWGKFWSNPTNLSKLYNVGEYPTTAPLAGQEQNHIAISWDMTPGYADRWFGLWINGEQVLYQQGMGRFNPDSVDRNVFSVGSNSTFGSQNGTNAGYDAVRVMDVAIDAIYTLNASGDFTPPGELGNEYLMPPTSCGGSGTIYSSADIDKDCYTDLSDFARMAHDWGECTDPAGCD